MTGGIFDDIATYFTPGLVAGLSDDLPVGCFGDALAGAAVAGAVCFVAAFAAGRRIGCDGPGLAFGLGFAKGSANSTPIIRQRKNEAAK